MAWSRVSEIHRSRLWLRSLPLDLMLALAGTEGSQLKKRHVDVLFLVAELWASSEKSWPCGLSLLSSVSASQKRIQKGRVDTVMTIGCLYGSF